MNKDFSNYKFRCSALGNLMTGGETITPAQLKLLKALEEKAQCKGLTDKQAITLEELKEKRDKKPELSQTTKSYLMDIYIEEVYGRVKDTSSKYTEKGLYCEEDGLSLASDHFDKLLIKNTKKFENEFVSGTPDCLTLEPVLDIKCSWDIWSFLGAKIKKEYYWQGIGYMKLTNKEKYKLVYCLCNSPEHLIVSEKSKAMYISGLAHDSEEWLIQEAQIEKNMMFDDIPVEKRIKVFDFEYLEEDYKKLVQRIEVARKYLQGLDEEWGNCSEPPNNSSRSS